MEKGEQKTVFDVPDNFLPDRYRAIGNELQNRFGEAAENRIPVKNISLPDLRIPMSLGRHEQFSLFIPAHRHIAGRLIDIFMGKYSKLFFILHTSLYRQVLTKGFIYL